VGGAADTGGGGGDVGCGAVVLASLETGGDAGLSIFGGYAASFGEIYCLSCYALEWLHFASADVLG